MKEEIYHAFEGNKIPMKIWVLIIVKKTSSVPSAISKISHSKSTQGKEIKILTP